MAICRASRAAKSHRMRDPGLSGAHAKGIALSTTRAEAPGSVLNDGIYDLSFSSDETMTRGEAGRAGQNYPARDAPWGVGDVMARGGAHPSLTDGWAGPQ